MQKINMHECNANTREFITNLRRILNSSIVNNNRMYHLQDAETDSLQN